ncbi:hypothetical protein C8R45DRAFT_925791 [Mycena sanguinolenta]|nr:hypothetical protein C8R45DRAFT_925791 [Mycena sanguinolenta]
MPSIARILPALLVVARVTLASPIVTRDDASTCAIGDARYSIQALQDMVNKSSYAEGLNKATVQSALRECCADDDTANGNRNAATPSSQRMDVLPGKHINGDNPPVDADPNAQEPEPCADEDLDASPNRSASDNSPNNDNGPAPTTENPSGSPHEVHVDEISDDQPQRTPAANKAPSDFPSAINQHSTPGATDKMDIDAEGEPKNQPGDNARVGVEKPNGASPSEQQTAPKHADLTINWFEPSNPSAEESPKIDASGERQAGNHDDDAKAAVNGADREESPELDGSADRQNDHAKATVEADPSQNGDAKATVNGADPEADLSQHADTTPSGDNGSNNRQGPSAGNFSPQNPDATASEPHDDARLSGDEPTPSFADLMFGQGAAEKAAKAPESCSCPT